MQPNSNPPGVLSRSLRAGVRSAPAGCRETLPVGWMGTTFKCFEDGPYVAGDMHPPPGSGLLAIYVYQPPLLMGDTFEGYPDGALVGGAPAAGVIGFSQIYVG
jgi:hypothetical protein